jgi:hypothetical protein
MKATELRIGNYVNKKNRFGEIEQIEIYGISARQNVYDEDDSIFGCDELIPILITNEWLLKFGFIKNDCDNYELEYTFKLNASFTIINKDRCYFYIDAPNHEIKHVHQLQNLYFALTNEEL